MFAQLFRFVVLILSLSFGTCALAQTTVTLMDGLNSYAGTTDTRIGNGGTNEGTATTYALIAETSTSLAVRFAIFQSEGGPVPNGSTISSATLSFYKYWGPTATFKASRFLKNWTETGATWSVTGAGQSWTSAGAQSAGNDYLATADGQGTVGDAQVDGCSTPPGGPWPAVCWLNIDVTPGAQAFASGTANYGWKVAYVTGGNASSPKEFNSRDNTQWSSLRPKLTITYTPPQSGNTATLMDGLNSYAGTTDARIACCASAGTNYGNDTTVALIAPTSTSFLVRFNIFAREGGPVPDNAAVTSATLSFYKYWGPSSVFSATRLKKSWNEGSVNWDLTGAGASWTTPGAFSPGNDIEASADGQGSVGDAQVDGCSTSGPFPAACWLNINVTSGVQAFAPGTTPNFGWKVAWESGPNPSNPKEFNTSENTSWPTLRSKLTVNYSVPTCSPVPTAQFSYTTSGLTATFNASGSTDGGAPITSLRLQFGDGQEVTWSDKNTPQQHTYAAPGTYTATLTATSTCGTSAPYSQQVSVGTPPTANFTWSQTPGTLTIVFNASSSTENGAPITSLRLQFGDGQEVTWGDKNQTQSHTYAAPGPYTATLTATNSYGTSAPNSQTVNVGDPGGGCTGDNVPTSPAAGTLGTTVPTFHSMSVYYNPQTTPSNETVWMRYRRACETAWREGWRLWFDPRTTGNALPYAYRARGSAVYLEPNTKYYFEVGTGSDYANATWLHYLEGTTWSETFAQDGATIVIPAGSTQYNITSGGSSSTGYKIYDAQNNLLALPGNSGQSHCVRITVSYVIVRNLRCTGAYAWGIAIAANVTNVVIEDSDISDWTWAVGGTTAWGTNGGNEYGGIHLESNNSRIVIQRNKIHDPHYGANPWDVGHPLGPNGITIYHGVTQNVIRYNEIYASGNTTDKMHWFMDGISGTDNFSTQGAPGADSDIYHNSIRNVMDDAIEAEGGGRNVRVWGNYLDHTGVGMGTSTAHFGPIYVFRNVFNRVRFYHMASMGHANPDDDGWDRGAGFKAYGVNGGYGGGRHYYFNNTMLQQPGSTYSPSQTFDLGAGESIYGSSSNSQGMRQVWTRNNVFHSYRSNAWNIDVGTGGGDNSFNYDLYNCCLVNESGGQFTEANGVHGLPTYKSGHGWSAFPRLTSEPNGPSEAVFGSGLAVGQGNFQLQNTAPTSQGLDAGLPLANFTYDIDNIALARKSGVEISGNPDMGAHDSALGQAMKFGLPAAQ